MAEKMRRRAFALAPLLAAGLAACAGGRAGPAAPESPGARTACATILSTNDTHGQLLPRTFRGSGDALVGGSAALAAWLDRAREASDCPAFLLSGGDVMQGTAISNLERGASTIEAFNALGYDAAALGNHEFDWGLDVLKERLAQARFPFLAANVFEKATGRRPGWIEPYAILERGGVRVGVIGLATASTPATTKPWIVADLEFRPISETLRAVVPEVRARGVDFVVALMHAGGFCRPDEGCSGEAFDALAGGGSGVDYAVTGHTHSFLRTRVGEIPVAQSRSSTAAFGVERLERLADGTVRADLPSIRVPWADSVVPDPGVAAIVDGYRARVAEISDRPLGIALARPLNRTRGGPTGYALGRLIADAQRSVAGTEVALMNNGGIRRNLPAGPLTYGDLLALQPFENVLVRLRLRGDRLLAALEHALESGSPDAHVGGLTVEYDPFAPAGGRVRTVTLADGRPLDRAAAYSVVVNDFMAGGGSGFTMLQEADSAEVTGIVDLDALIEYLRSLPQPVAAPDDVRWRHATPAEAEGE
ncbi:MAG: bifunctional metallophosphatase/5'-nucleotidase [Gemmatimonadota bacterium]